MVVERLQELQRKYALEHDPNKKREVLEQIFALIRVGLEEFLSLSKEENPHQLLLLVAELSRVSEKRLAQFEEPDAP